MELETIKSDFADAVARNVFYSEKRRSWRTIELDPETAERTLISVGNPTSGIELDEVRRAITMLAKDQHEALILIGAAGLSYEEASEIAQVPVGTIKSRVSRARDRLAMILGQGNIRPDGLPAHAAMGAIFTQIQTYQRPRAA